MGLPSTFRTALEYDRRAELGYGDSVRLYGVLPDQRWPTQTQQAVTPALGQVPAESLSQIGLL